MFESVTHSNSRWYIFFEVAIQIEEKNSYQVVVEPSLGGLLKGNYTRKDKPWLKYLAAYTSVQAHCSP